MTQTSRVAVPAPRQGIGDVAADDALSVEPTDGPGPGEVGWTGSVPLHGSVVTAGAPTRAGRVVLVDRGPRVWRPRPG
ncbi:hypothetical protein JD79_04258 [Geodermatophilus normandii]|uniref:Uncharacterized protein n=1 Tax=Geodermatophilus normandii TaxID=1137989 RepID=A0A317QQ05_9ACTN|nr:hypothetical protein JD79_04258 [Geodermatophilus normandii]